MTRIDRRDLLKGALLAGAALEPARAAAKPPRIGFVGTGARGTALLELALRFEGVEVPAVCDINEANRARARKIVAGRGAKPREWEPADERYAEFEHPLWRGIDPNKYKTARGQGGGADTALMWERYFNAIRSGSEPDMTVYDAATWSAAIPLTERSVAGNGRPVEFPDFTRGRWKTTPPVKLA